MMGEERKEAEEREPICGFCWARRNTRQPLEFKPLDGYWECPVCLTKTINPLDMDEEALRADYDPDPRRFEKTIASTLRIKGSGSKSGRRKKAPVKKTFRPRSPKEEQDYVDRYNERLKREAVQKAGRKE